MKPDYKSYIGGESYGNKSDKSRGCRGLAPCTYLFHNVSRCATSLGTVMINSAYMCVICFGTIKAIYCMEDQTTNSVH